MCPTHAIENMLTFLRRTQLGFEKHTSYMKRNSKRPVGYKLHKAFLKQTLDEEMNRRAAVSRLKKERTDRRRGAADFAAGGSLLKHIKNDYKGPRREPRNIGVTVFFGDDAARLQKPRRARVQQ